MPSEETKSLHQKIKRILDATISLSARTVIPATALVAIWHAQATGASLPSGLEVIASGIGVEALGHILSKFDKDEEVADDEIRKAIEQALSKYNLENRMLDEAFQQKIDQLLQSFQVLGTALQIHENSIVRRIFAGLSYYRELGSQLVENFQELREGLIKLDPEMRFLTSLITRLEGIEGTLEYVDLGGEIRAREPSKIIRKRRKFIDPSFVVLSKGESELRQTSIPLESIREVIGRYRRFVLIGDPGSGKTTTLRRLALDAAWERFGNREAPIPLYLELPRWRDNQDLEAFLSREWPLDLDLMVALIQGRVFLFLDGLNEMGVDGAAIIGELKKWINSRNKPEYVAVTCRKDDYTSAIDLGITTVLIKEMSEQQIHDFVANYLEDEAADFLKNIVSDGTTSTTHQLIQLAQNPFMLRALIIIYQDSPDKELPRNAGLLFQDLVKYLWFREKERNTPHWIDYDVMLSAFSRLAFSMFDEDKSTTVPVEYALNHIHNMDLLHVGQSANLIIVMNDGVRFYHQLIQEYFAAEYMQIALLKRVVPPQQHDEYHGHRQASEWDQVVISFLGITSEREEAIKIVVPKSPMLVTKWLLQYDTIPNAIYETSIKLLRESLKSDDWGMRCDAADSLGLLKDRESVSLLVDLLIRDPYNDVKFNNLGQPLVRYFVKDAAAWALGEIGDPNSVPHLIEAMSLHPRTSVVWAVQDALVRIGRPVVPFLTDILVHPSPYGAYIRRQIIEVLGKIGDPSAVPILIACLRDETIVVHKSGYWPQVRVCDEAADALEKIGTEEARIAASKWKDHKRFRQ